MEEGKTLVGELKAEVLRANQQLLDSIANGDLQTYEKLCCPSLTCFEPETKDHLVEGLDFHKFFFALASHTEPTQGPRKNTTIVSPHVRLLGESVAVASYTRLVQSSAPSLSITSCVETRVWQRSAEHGWRNVHFHRSSSL